jgi:hypothetical protein
MFDGNDIVPEEQLKKAVAPFEKTEIQEKALRHTDSDAEDPFSAEVFEGDLIDSVAAECTRVYGFPISLSSITPLCVLPPQHTDTDAEDPFHTLIFGCNLTAECKRGPNWIRKMEKSIIDEQGIHSED